jgi:TPR repeat protein
VEACALNSLRLIRQLLVLLAGLAATSALAFMTPPGMDVGSLHTASERGDPRAQGELAEAYYHGRGIPRDLLSAEYWARLAADQGNATAQHRLGVMYLHGEGPLSADTAKAVEWLNLAAENGHAQSQYMLGRMLVHGQGVELDEAQGRVWLEKARAQGMHEARRAIDRLDASQRVR